MWGLESINFIGKKNQKGKSLCMQTHLNQTPYMGPERYVLGTSERQGKGQRGSPDPVPSGLGGSGSRRSPSVRVLVVHFLTGALNTAAEDIMAIVG